MAVEKCLSCGARYDVSTFEAGATFSCRRCTTPVTVGGAGTTPADEGTRWGLLTAGVLMVLGLFAYAHPTWGARAAKWPWVHWIECGSMMIRADITLWTATGTLAILAALGIGGRHRFLVLASVTALLLARCYAVPSAFQSFWMELHWMVCAVLLGAGFAVEAGADAGGRGFARGLMLVGAMGIALIYAIWVPDPQQPTLFAVGMYRRELLGVIDGTVPMAEFWKLVLPYSIQFLAVLFGLTLAATSAARAVTLRRVAALVGFSFLLLLWLEPLAVAAAHSRQAIFSEKGSSTVANLVVQGLFSETLAPWLVATLAIASIVRAQAPRSLPTPSRVAVSAPAGGGAT